MAEVQYLPTVVNVKGVAGDRVRWKITVSDSGGPLDWSGYEFDAQVRVNANDTSSPVATIVVDDSQAAIGVLTLTVAKTNTASMLAPGPSAPSSKTWVWDMQRTLVADPTDVRTTHGGQFTLVMDVTR